MHGFPCPHRRVDHQRFIVADRSPELPGEQFVTGIGLVRGAKDAMEAAREVQLSQQKEQVEQIHIEEESIETQEFETDAGGRGRGGGGSERGGEGERAHPSGRIAFANYENAFLLCAAPNASAFLRRILSGGAGEPIERDVLRQEFWLFELPEPILVGAGRPGPFPWPFILGVYALSAQKILETAARNRVSRPLRR
jgi:hypothetical protein